LNIILKVGRGKYFDVSSLSGGEKTIVALSLIFAIQEYKPYCFYIFDEIDAALDKHNSELLAALIKKYMLSGQYIVVSHNDALITEASALYGVSMQENISKIISLKNE
jgi:chromosome segregation protein